MSKLIRHYQLGQIYFITTVTHSRAPILITNFDIFWKAVKRTKLRLRFELIAWVVLPDHIHLIIDPLENNLSDILNRIKRSFAHQLRVCIGKNLGKVWQGRFWDHVIRDENDLNTHLDYIHYNPVHHDYISNPFDWRYSSLGEFYTNGLYPPDWGIKEGLSFKGEHGE